ncbi:MAG: sigma-54-dependent transcriptional regulator [Magnetovibrionaceae bacterium]
MADTGPRQILLIEDSLPMARLYQAYLKPHGYSVTHADTGQAGMNALGRATPDAIILDVKLPDMNGLEILRHVREQGLGCGVVVITAHGSVNMAVEAMQAGASDFLLKPFSAERLTYTLKNVLERVDLTELVETLSKERERTAFGGFIGASPSMQAVYRTIESAAQSKATVFVTGESGTGKEVCAQSIHQASDRRDGPFIAINCAAIPGELMESEIFGHVKGAFTGAVSDRLGAARLATGGTLFLDEICEMDISLQAKLLRFIQTGQFTKVGGSQLESTDIRFVCATNRDPWSEVRAGNFREDLYYRLHVIPIHLPPLKERDRDVLEIAAAFLNQFAAEEGKSFDGFDPDAQSMILNHGWPGNVRELQNVVRSVVVLHDGPMVTEEMLAGPLSAMRPSASPSERASASQVDDGAGPTMRSEKTTAKLELRPLADVEWEYIQAALQETEGSVPKAAQILKVSASTIYRRLREQGAA